MEGNPKSKRSKVSKMGSESEVNFRSRRSKRLILKKEENNNACRYWAQIIPLCAMMDGLILSPKSLEIMLRILFDPFIHIKRQSPMKYLTNMKTVPSYMNFSMSATYLMKSPNLIECIVSIYIWSVFDWDSAGAYLFYVTSRILRVIVHQTVSEFFYQIQSDIGVRVNLLGLKKGMTIFCSNPILHSKKIEAKNLFMYLEHYTIVMLLAFASKSLRPFHYSTSFKPSLLLLYQ